ncbi:efflux RND transporter periplasmic adaptor subunit [Hahella sp. HN01]|uniref:efflux RND transporter periplasmic adaptor subunit n=1 Tax=Hahella sp. HN01 TaxID=2847262 RepID=UPI001C1EEFBB|nr:efflux RND transporter periplasmic adaptor subunit [Hahella sp. HN01]MBU6955684.1 efflux RND transporter periplasmic adaptor subunit [Hahella sp. HN01]
MSSRTLNGALTATLISICIAGTTLAAGRPPTSVVAASTQSAPYYDKIEALGTVSANESVNITPKITEKVISVHFDDGVSVKRGDVLIKLDDEEEQANLRSTLAVQAERESAYRRAQELYNRRVGSEADLDAARARVDQSKAEIEAIRTRISAHQITAPFNGVLGLRNISVGALVEPSDVLTTLDDLSVVKVDFAIPSVFLANLKPGLKVEAETSAYPKQVFSGELKSISPRVDPVTRTVQARALFDNPGRMLLPGMLLQLDLQSRPRTTLVIPESAIATVGTAHYVFVVVEGEPAKAQRRQVGIGSRKAGKVEILKGLEEGDLVISHGLVKISDGSAVKVIAVDDGALNVAKLLQGEQQAEQTE